MSSDSPREPVLIFAPAGRDAVLVADSLKDLVGTLICHDAVELCQQLKGAAAAVLTEEALDPPGTRQLAQELRRQDGWSDIPLIVLTAARPTAAENRRTLERLNELGNVMTLERPVHPATLGLAVRSALRAREHQYRTRDLLAERQNAVQQRDAFLAILGHELRNPLGAINNAVRIFRDPRANEQMRQSQVAVIERQAILLQRLVNDLLDVSRVTTGKVVLQREPIDLRPLIERVVIQALPLANDAQLRLTMSCEPTTVTVLGDEVRLEQVFSNLLGNSIKYTPAGGKIDVSITDTEDETLVTVADTGVGIDPEALPRIFELFAQSNTTLDRSGGGMGIGLTLVQSLTTLHGGRVRAESDGRGKGSRFTVTLPLATSLPRPKESQATEAVAESGLRIVLIEDNLDIRETLKTLLEFIGHRVTTAATGPEGVRAVLAERPDAAIIDIGLPDLDGYQVGAQLRLEMKSETRLIALSGYSQPEDIERAMRAGFNAHASKPVDIDELDALIRKR